MAGERVPSLPPGVAVRHAAACRAAVTSDQASDLCRSKVEPHPDPPTGPGRGPVRCQVWLAHVDLLRPCHHKLLDELERARHQSYLREADRARFALGAALLRIGVAHRLEISPYEVRVDRRCAVCARPHGKPTIPDTTVQVSVSHSGDLVALALTQSVPVGVDIEAIVPTHVTGIARAVLSPEETLVGEADFFTYWCRKESAIKATGDGLRTPLRRVIVSPADTPARLLTYRGAPLPCAMADLPVPPGYAGAVAVLAHDELDLCVGSAGPLLGA